jgi:hypothetical protein
MDLASGNKVFFGKNIFSGAIMKIFSLSMNLKFFYSIQCTHSHILVLPLTRITSTKMPKMSGRCKAAIHLHIKQELEKHKWRQQQNAEQNRQHINDFAASNVHFSISAISIYRDFDKSKFISQSRIKQFKLL